MEVVVVVSTSLALEINCVWDATQQSSPSVRLVSSAISNECKVSEFLMEYTARVRSFEFTLHAPSPPFIPITDRALASVRGK